jgi:OOP family OmpA-OmpF porin
MKRVMLSLLAIFFGVLLFSYHARATTVDFKKVYFKESLPKRGDTLSGSAVMFDQYAVDAMQANKSTYLTLKSSSKLRIVGYTDNAECSASACDSLSLRRARLVCDWLLAHGFPARRLLPPEGHGAKDAIDTNDTPDGRQRNRRVEFQVN